ncbi:MAG: phosphatase PAP2 family protein [Deltaproteobacteria bacterium]
MRFDTELFYLINTRLTNHFLDIFMPYVTQKFNFFGVLALVAAALMFIAGGKKERWGLALLIIAVFSADFLAAELKHVFGRIRPCNALEGVRLLAGCGGSFSFPSAHAVNITAAMVFLTARHRKYAPVFLPVAFIISYSRVYVGVHYPLDVAGGALLGAAVAIAFYGAGKLAVRNGCFERLRQYYSDRRGSF